MKKKGREAKYYFPKKLRQELLAVPINKLPNGAKIVYLSLIERLQGKQICWPSQKRIASDTGMSDRMVRKHIKTLIDIKILKVYQATPNNPVGKKTRGAVYDFSGKVRIKERKRKSSTSKRGD